MCNYYVPLTYNSGDPGPPEVMKKMAEQRKAEGHTKVKMAVRFPPRSSSNA